MIEVKIEGPVLLLMGPLGTFFGRLSKYLLKQDIEVHKVQFPFWEFGVPQKCKHYFDKPLSLWEDYITSLYQSLKIKHVFMYGDFITPHQIAIDVAKKQGIDAYVFELGYVRPNYITLEKNQVNARSNLNQPVEFYQKKSQLTVASSEPVTKELKWRKLFLIPAFIQHALTQFKVIEGEHKLQPKPSYLYYQMLGYARYHLYQKSQKKVNKQIDELADYFLVVLQVALDSQLSLSSKYKDMYGFIQEVMQSFSQHANASDSLIIKHHPRDRGYNNYKKFITQLSKNLGIEGRVFYIHDKPIGSMLSRTKGVIMVNSSVGLQSLHCGVPTKVMGKTFYNLPGLTDQKPLSDFWGAPEKVDEKLFKSLYATMINKTQVRGCFNGSFPFEKLFITAHSAIMEKA